MTPSTSSRTLSVRARLLIVAGLCALLACAPTAMLGLRFTHDLAFVRGELAALPANRAWHAVITDLQAHRQHAAAAAAHPEAEARRAAAAQRALRSFGAVHAALEAGGASERRRQAAATLRTRFEALAAAHRKRLPLAELLQRHRDFADQVFDEVAQLNAEAQLLLDPQATAYFAIVAGLQVAPRIGDALSELSAIAAAAAVDDIGAVSSSATRYREHMGALQLNLQLAAQSDARSRADFAPVLEQSVAQRRMVDATLAAAAADVNYPLDTMSQALANAASLQARLSTTVIDSVEGELARRAAAARRQAAAVFCLIVAGLGLVGVLLWRTVRGILRQVMTAVAVTELIADGDLSQPVPAHRNDELGRVLGAIASMQVRLRGLVEQIHGASGQIRHGAAEIAAGNQDLSQRTEHAAASLQHTAASMAHIGEAAQQGANAAREATALAEQASQAAQRGGEIVGAVVRTMSGIHASSKKIADITGVIDGIAFQTNILALNAAVEAARAGEHGRGFAVVAAEVRSLAQRSGQAAREIKQLIQSSVERTDDGSRLAGEAGQAMAGIVQRIAQASAAMQTVSATVQSQSAGLGNVHGAIGHLDDATQRNAALVEQSAAAAESMRQQATSLQALMNVFRLEPAAR